MFTSGMDLMDYTVMMKQPVQHIFDLEQGIILIAKSLAISAEDSNA